MNDLSLMGVETLHIVVDKPRALATTDITLLTPKPAPEKLLPNHGFLHDTGSAFSTPNVSPVTWQSLEDMHVQDITNFKARTEEAVAEFIKSLFHYSFAAKSGITDTEIEGRDLDDTANWRDYYVDKLDRPWTVKKIHYV